MRHFSYTFFAVALIICSQCNTNDISRPNQKSERYYAYIGFDALTDTTDTLDIINAGGREVHERHSIDSTRNVYCITGDSLKIFTVVDTCCLLSIGYVRNDSLEYCGTTGTMVKEGYRIEGDRLFTPWPENMLITYRFAEDIYQELEQFPPKNWPSSCTRTTVCPGILR